jgi:hypothetical protein
MKLKSNIVEDVSQGVWERHYHIYKGVVDIVSHDVYSRVLRDTQFRADTIFHRHLNNAVLLHQRDLV